MVTPVLSLYFFFFVISKFYEEDTLKCASILLLIRLSINCLTDICISMDSWFLFQTLGFVLHHLFWQLNFPRFGQWCPVQDDFFVFLTCPCYYWNIFLLSGSARDSKLILYFSCHNPEINHFSRKPWFLLVKNVI